MADENELGLSSVDLRYGTPAPEEDVSWTDYLKGMQSGAASQIGGGIAAVVEDLSTPGSRTNNLASDIREDSNAYAKRKMEEASPKFQRRAGANFFYGDGPSVWQEGIAGSLLAKAAVSAPSIIATAVPGGMVGRAFQSAKAGLVAAQAAGGALTAGSVINEIYNELAKLPDETLMEASPAYAGYRNMGMPEREARQQIKNDVSGVEPYLVGAISALIPGAEGALASRLGGHAATGSYLGTMAKRALGEGAQEFVEESTGELAQQQAMQPFTMSDFDWMKALEAGAQGAAVGAPMGGVSGMVERVGGGTREAPKPGVTQQVEIPEPDASLDTGGVDPAQKVALDEKLAQPKPKRGKSKNAPEATAPPAGDPNAAPAVTKQATPKQLERAKQRAAAKAAAQPPVQAEAPAAPVTQQVTPPVAAPAVETPEQEAARLAASLSPGVDPAAAVALESKAAPTPAPPEQEAAQLVKDLTQPASAPVAANPVPSVPLVSSAQAGPVAAEAAPVAPVASPETRTPSQEQVSTTVDPPAATTPYDRALALIDGGTPLTSVNAVQNKVGVAYNTAVKLYNRLKQEGRTAAPAQTPTQKPSKAPPAANSVPPVATQPEAVRAAPDGFMNDFLNNNVQERVPGPIPPDSTTAWSPPEAVTQQVTEEAPKPKRKPKGEALKEKVAAKKAEENPVRKVEVSDEEKARLVAASEQKLPTRRILAPGTLEARKAAEEAAAAMVAQQAQREAAAKIAEKEAKKREKEAEKQAQGEKVGGDKNKTRVAKMEDDAVAARNIISQGTPSEITTVTTPEHKTALTTRLNAIVEEAERQGLEIRTINRDSVPAPLVYLADARMMAKKIANGKATYAEINEFLRDEFDVRSGGGDMMRQRRKEVNAQNANRAASTRNEEQTNAAVVEDSGKIENAVEVRSAADEVTDDDKGGPIARDRNEADDTLESDTSAIDAEIASRDTLRVGRKEASLEVVYPPAIQAKVTGLRIKARKLAELASDTSKPKEVRDNAKKLFDTATTALAEIAKQHGKVDTGAREDKAGTFQKVEAGGRRKLGVTINVPKGVPLLKKARPLSTQQAAAEENTSVDGKPMYGPSTSASTNSDSEEFYTTAPELMGFVRERFQKNNPNINSAIHDMVSKRVADIIGDVDTFVVSDERMRELVKEQFEGDEIPAGVYFHDSDQIVILEKALLDPKMQFVVLHEALHAATVHTMKADEELRSEIKSIMAFVGDRVDKWHYGFTNEYEFIAEAASNPKFQHVLMNIPLTPELAKKYGPTTLVRSAWDWMLTAIRRAMGFPAGMHTAFDAAMRVTDRILTTAKNTGRLAADPSDTMDLKAFPAFISNSVKRLTQQVTNTPVTDDELISDAGPRLMGLRTFDNISRAADTYFGGADNNPVRTAQEVIEKMRVHGQDVFERSAPLIESLYQLEKKYSGKHWDNFAKLTHDATMLNVHPDKPISHPDNAHLSRRKDAAAIAEWQNLNNAWKALPDELKVAWSRTTGYYRDMQNAMAFSILKNRVLKALAGDMSEAELDALARRYFNNISTEADATKLGKELDSALKAVDELKSIKGPYFPQMRRGDWAVIGRVQFPQPGNAKKLDDTTFRFGEEKDALAYANRVWREAGLKATVKRQYIDPATGLTYFVDDDGTKVKANSKEPEALKQFVVSVQDEFLEYHGSMKEAEDRAAEIGKTMKKVAVEERRVQPQARGELYSEQLRSVMKRIEQKDAYKTLTPEARAETVRALNELSYQLFGATRIQSRRLPRRYVAGASKDVTRNAADYSQSVAGYIGKLRYQPELDAAVKKMHDYNEANRYQDRQRTIARSRIANEVDRRVSGPPQAFITKMDHNIQRVLTVSFLDKLATLSHSIINSTQTITNTMPLLASRHGWARSTKAMGQAYSMIGGGRNIGTGLANVGRAVKATQQVNLLEPVRQRLAKHGPEYVQLFDYLRERGVASSDAGMEVMKAVRMDGGVMGAVDKGLAYGDAIARALPDAVEVNNRMASAIASYMLGRAKNMTPEQARRYAYDTVNGTQFNYSQTNAPAFMSNPMARIVFQFKKYAQGQYQLLGEQLGKALHGATRQEKMEGVKALVNFTATTMMFAGALGLPTEPIKYALMAASMFGLGYSYDDMERDVRKKMAEWLGPTAGEMVTRGVTRGLPAGFAFDLSSRMSLSDLTSFGAPKENTKDAWSAWLWQTVSGAPVSLGTDLIRGTNMIATGEYQKGIELMLPFKQVSDALTSYRLATEGKRSGVTNRQTLDPLNGPETVMRTLGFRPGREAETLERDNAYYKVKKERMGERQSLVSKWLNTTGDERADVWKKIVKYNAGVDEVARISMAQLTTAQKRRNSEVLRGTIVDGKRVTKDDRAIYDTGNIYNVR